jgi:hypothetical protein
MCLSLGLACLGKDWAHHDRKVVQDGAALPQSVFAASRGKSAAYMAHVYRQTRATACEAT